jgi:2-hydroxychromene-2-carboxylate isomerase
VTANAPARPAPAAIEYFYSAHSAFAYIGSRRFMAIARAAGRPIVHKPYDLRRGIIGVGSPPPGQRSGAHRRYFFGREIERWSEERSAPIMGRLPTHHHHDITLPNCLLIAAASRGDDIDTLAHALLEAHWRDDADLADPATLIGLASGVGLDGHSLLAAAGSDSVIACYAANTAEAIRRSVFGSPTYFVDGDMFYGQDRLEMMERALARPYRGSWMDVEG